MNVLDRLRLALERRRQDRMIRRHGWTGVYVGDYREAPTWAYTIGLDGTLDHPELVVFDLTREDATEVFWTAIDEIRAGTLKLEDGVAWPAASDAPGVWRKVHPDHVDEWLPLAGMRRFAKAGKRYGLQAFQFVLSDHGTMPWEPGYDERLRARQPALYEPTDRPAVEEVAANGGV